jgi:glycosyltransferase involved in cell wall biosynthesis
MPPLVSVIIPTYNRLALLEETIASVRSQTFRDFELLVIDDGSSDGTGEWLESQPGIRFVTQTNSGIASSRNKGAAISSGKWLAFLDHDDLWDPRKLEIQAQFAQKHPELGMLAIRHVRLGSKVKPQRKPEWTMGDLFLKEYSESFIHTSSVLIRRDVFENIGGFPTQYRFADEFDVWLKIARSYPIAFYNEPLVFIRLYHSNTSHNRIGVRGDTYDILTKHYDPDRIPEHIYLRTMSDHDISFGRAFIKAGDLENALRWFRKSVERTPFRFRSWRYYLRYRLLSIFRA